MNLLFLKRFYNNYEYGCMSQALAFICYCNYKLKNYAFIMINSSRDLSLLNINILYEVV